MSRHPLATEDRRIDSPEDVRRGDLLLMMSAYDATDWELYLVRRNPFDDVDYVFINVVSMAQCTSRPQVISRPTQLMMRREPTGGSPILYRVPRIAET